jgi:hypothetical protein
MDKEMLYKRNDDADHASEEVRNICGLHNCLQNFLSKEQIHNFTVKF